MHGAWVYQMRESHLVDVSKALVIWVTHDPPDEWVVDGDEPVHGVVYDLADVGHRKGMVKAYLILITKLRPAPGNR